MPVSLTDLREFLLPGLEEVNNPNQTMIYRASKKMVDPDFSLDEIEKAQEVLNSLR